MFLITKTLHVAEHEQLGITLLLISNIIDYSIRYCKYVTDPYDTY